MSAFCNHLTKGDRVLNTKLGREGTIAAKPRETSRYVQIQYDNRTSVGSADVMDLRIILDGRAEDVPPVTGEPPERQTRTEAQESEEDAVLTTLRAQRARHDNTIQELEHKLRMERSAIERLDRAIKVLTDQPPIEVTRAIRIA